MNGALQDFHAAFGEVLAGIITGFKQKKRLIAFLTVLSSSWDSGVVPAGRRASPRSTRAPPEGQPMNEIHHRRRTPRAKYDSVATALLIVCRFHGQRNLHQHQRVAASVRTCALHERARKRAFV